MNKIPEGRKTIILNGILVGEYDSTGDTESDIEAVRQFLKDKGLQKETSPFIAALNQAISFSTASNYLYNRDLRLSPRNGASIAPFVVNAAFSIELYLKALSLKHGVALHGHVLSKLYDKLPVEAKAEIQVMAQRCAVDSELGLELGKTPNFFAYLSELDNTFIEWRYSFEKERTGIVQIQPTIFVMGVLHEACRLQMP